MASLHARMAGVGLKNLGNTCFVNSLECIFHTPLLRGFLLSMAQNYTHHRVILQLALQAPYSTHHYEYENMIDNIGHMFCLLGISEFSVNVLSLCSSCHSIAAVQRPECKTKHGQYCC